MSAAMCFTVPGNKPFTEISGTEDPSSIFRESCFGDLCLLITGVKTVKVQYIQIFIKVSIKPPQNNILCIHWLLRWHVSAVSFFFLYHHVMISGHLWRQYCWVFQTNMLVSLRSTSEVQSSYIIVKTGWIITADLFETGQFTPKIPK